MYRGGADLVRGEAALVGLRRDGLGVVEESGGAEHGGEDGEEAEHEHQRHPGHRQIQHQLRAVEHRPQRHPLVSPTLRLARPALRASRRRPISPATEAERGRGGGGGGEAAGGTRGAARAGGEAARRPPGRAVVPSVNRDAVITWKCALFFLEWKHVGYIGSF